MRLYKYLGALLLAAPLFCQSAPADPTVRDGSLVWFELGETRSEIAARLGPPALVAPFGDDFIAWQYKNGTDDHDAFSHHLIFRRSDGKLAAVTRNFDQEQPISTMFPEKETGTHWLKKGGRNVYGVRVRRLAGDRALVAMGATKPGDTTSSLMLVRVRELRYLYPWLYDALTPAAPPPSESRYPAKPQSGWEDGPALRPSLRAAPED